MALIDDCCCSTAGLPELGRTQMYRLTSTSPGKIVILSNTKSQQHPLLLLWQSGNFISPAQALVSVRS
jgi:SOS-response transcriptional repressor LexA